jgi:hypothetical protein
MHGVHGIKKIMNSYLQEYKYLFFVILRFMH